jgi:phosphoribosylformylglycinamidine synthase
MVGASVDLVALGARPDAVLFGETQSRIVVSCAPEHLERIVNVALPVTVLGATGGGALKIKTSRGELSWDVARLRDVWWNALGRLMDA